MKKLVLFDSNVGNAGAPLALLSITRLLDLSQYDVRIITKAAHPEYLREVVRECDGALCLGVTSILGPWLATGLDVSRAVKKQFPQLPIIWGGWAPTTLPELALQEDCIDYVCVGQGERTFSEFVAALSSGRDPSGIQGLGFKREGKPVLNAPREPENINAFPDYSLDLIDWGKHLEASSFGQRTLTMYTSIGCPWRCAFCCEQYYCGRRWSGLTPERVVDYLVKLKAKVDFDSMNFCDDNFFVNEKRTAEICRLLIDRRLGISYGNVDGRSNELLKYKDETWTLMRESGLRSILNGAESANNATLELITKDITVEQTWALVRRCAAYGVWPILSCVLGWDAKRYSDVGADRAFREELDELFGFFRKIHLTVTSKFKMWVFCYIPLPATPLYATAVQYGFKPPSSLSEWAQYDLMRYTPPWMLGVHRRQLWRLRMFRYLAQLTGTDYRNYARGLPWVLRTAAVLVVRTAEAIASLRIRTGWLGLPVDMLVFEAMERAFRMLNRGKRFVNIHG